jgi:hypothetical protein
MFLNVLAVHWLQRDGQPYPLDDPDGVTWSAEQPDQLAASSALLRFSLDRTSASVALNL